MKKELPEFQSSDLREHIRFIEMRCLLSFFCFNYQFAFIIPSVHISVWNSTFMFIILLFFITNKSMYGCLKFYANRKFHSRYQRLVKYCTISASHYIMRQYLIQNSITTQKNVKKWSNFLDKSLMTSIWPFFNWFLKPHLHWESAKLFVAA